MTSVLQVAMPFTILFENPKPVLEIQGETTQILFGEAFEFKEAEGAFLHGTAKTSDVSGWLHQDSLTPQSWLPTHFIDAVWAPVFPNAHAKSWAMVSLPFLSRIETDVEKSKDGYSYIPTLQGYIHNTHIKPLAHLQKPQPALLSETAKRFIGAPYQIGGRSIAGMDGAGLIQLSLLRSGYTAPHRLEAIQSTIGKASQKDLSANDIVFWKDQAGIAIDSKTVITVSKDTMSVVLLPFSEIENPIIKTL